MLRYCALLLCFCLLGLATLFISFVVFQGIVGIITKEPPTNNFCKKEAVPLKQAQFYRSKYTS